MTRVSCSCRYVGEKDAESQTCTCLALYARTRDGEWDCVARRQMVAEPMSLTVELDANAEYVEDGIVAGEGWKEIVIPDGAKTGSVVSLENVLSEKIPVGKVLTLRWRHDKVALGPLLTLDDVGVRFSGDASGFCVIVR